MDAFADKLGRVCAWCCQNMIECGQVILCKDIL